MTLLNLGNSSQNVDFSSRPILHLFSSDHPRVCKVPARKELASVEHQNISCELTTAWYGYGMKSAQWHYGGGRCNSIMCSCRYIWVVLVIVTCLHLGWQGVCASCSLWITKCGVR